MLPRPTTARAAATRVSRLPWLEYAIVLTITVTIAAAGILTGVAVGLGLTVLLFVVTYASNDAAKHDLSGTTARSRVRWEAHDRARLDRHADELLRCSSTGSCRRDGPAGPPTSRPRSTASSVRRSRA